MMIDTGGLLAALLPDQDRREACAAALLAATRPRVVSSFVLAELDYLIGKLADAGRPGAADGCSG